MTLWAPFYLSLHDCFSYNYAHDILLSHPIRSQHNYRTFRLTLTISRPGQQCTTCSMYAWWGLIWNTLPQYGTLTCKKDVNLLEKIQWFACKLRHQLPLPTLANSKLHVRLCNMNEIICGLLYFPPDVICPTVTMPHNIRSHLLYQPYARTNAYFDYYVPSTISHQCQRREQLPEHLCLRRQWLPRGREWLPRICIILQGLKGKDETPDTFASEHFNVVAGRVLMDCGGQSGKQIQVNHSMIHRWDHNCVQSPVE